MTLRPAALAVAWSIVAVGPLGWPAAASAGREAVTAEASAPGPVADAQATSEAAPASAARDPSRIDGDTPVPIDAAPVADPPVGREPGKVGGEPPRFANPAAEGSADPVMKSSAEPAVKSSADPAGEGSADPAELTAPINPDRGVEGHRNLFCSHYDVCLDQAVKGCWNSCAKDSADPAVKGSADPVVKRSADLAAGGSADPAVKASVDPSVTGSADPAAEGSAEPAAEGSAEPAVKAPAEPEGAGSEIGPSAPPPGASEASGSAAKGEKIDPDQATSAEEAAPPGPDAEARRPGGPAPDAEGPGGREAADADVKPPPMSPPSGAPGRSATFSFRPAGQAGMGTSQQLQQRLAYQYGWGSESDVVYRRNPDLNNVVRDDTVIVKPQLHGFVTYRPFDWLEATLDMIVEWEVAALQEAVVVLPNGEIQNAEKRGLSVFADNAYLTFKIPHNIQLSVGRRNWEDERHWLADTAMDGVSASVKLGYLRIDAFGGREVLLNLDLVGGQRAKMTRTSTTPSRPIDEINTTMLMLDYRGFEDIRMFGYAIVRDDRGGQEGRLLTLGANVYGLLGRRLGYWAEAALLRGKDERSQRMEAFGFDLGGTYRFTDLPLYPGVGLGYAFGSGDGNPDDGTNREFRQTGLQSNEVRLLGIPRFKGYGEALDPELSNLQVLTAGAGIRPARTVTLDLVYHHYWLNKIAVELRNVGLTAQMNEAARTSRNVGAAIDLVVGVRNLFESRFGLDLRVGWFFPGTAFAVKGGTEENPTFSQPDQGFSMFAKVWW